MTVSDPIVGERGGGNHLMSIQMSVVHVESHPVCLLTVNSDTSSPTIYTMYTMQYIQCCMCQWSNCKDR